MSIVTPEKRCDFMSKVAVLIPSFKPGVYIKDCLKSIEEQTLSKELYCVYIALNGPRLPYMDNIQVALSECSFNYRIIYSEEPNVSNARNILLNVSKEEYITFLDDDDRISVFYLESLLMVASTDYVVVCNVLCFGGEAESYVPNYIGRAFSIMDDVVRSKFRARKFYSSSCAKLIPRNLIGDIRFDTKLKRGEDSLFMAQLSGNVDCVRKAEGSAIYFVYFRPNSASRSKPEVMDEIVRILYLTSKYTRLLFDSHYEKFFILSRIIATLIHLKRIF